MGSRCAGGGRILTLIGWAGGAEIGAEVGFLPPI